VGYAWGLPLVVLLVGGGLLLTFYSRLLPFRGLGHALRVLRGDFDGADDPGQVSHFGALSTALASTVGMGNIGGVAVALTQGGPGAIFWMWVAALVGMATKFFTCSLAVLYRGRDSLGTVQGGPMYYIEVGLGRRWRFAAVFFSIFGMVGCLALFQANQLAEALASSFEVPPWLTGGVAMVLVAVVVLGGIERIAAVAGRIVPLMCLLYLVLAAVIVVANASEVPRALAMIFHDAFCGTAAAGGAAGIAWQQVIQTGIKRAAFSNEAGLGTAPMAHGAARTSEPIREGLVAMVGPFVDTIVVCTLTALVILVSGGWQVEGIRGIALTAQAFETSLGFPGRVALMIMAALFAVTTMFGYSYYGKKCFSYLFGAHRARLYDWFYLVMILAGALWTADVVVNLVDTAFAMMALPNMVVTLVLAPKVMVAAKAYFARHL
jgi:AGCS family alanine or glycine:cation symporter